MEEANAPRDYGSIDKPRMAVEKEGTPRRMDVDDMLAHAGDFGRYQYFLMFLFAVLNILSAFHYFGTLFVGMVPDHWCHTPDLHVDLRDPDARALWTPKNRGSCFRFDVNLTGVTSPNGSESWPVRPCDDGWEYDRIWGYQSIASEMNWVCDDLWRSTFGMSLFFVGCVFGTLCLGFLADQIGRLHVLVFANLVALAGNLATSFTTSFFGYVGCRFIAGMATDNNFVMLYIIVLEYMRPSRRTIGLNLTIGVFYTIGCVVLPWVALAIGNWRVFLMITTAPLIVIPLSYFVVPESAQWLLSKGKIDRAIRCFERVAKINRKTLDPKVVEEFRNSSKKESDMKSPSLLGLFKTPNLRRKTCILIFKSIVLTLCYDAISRNVTGLAYDSFTVFSITSVTTLPACLIILALQDRIGRKAMACSSLVFTGGCMITAGILLAVRGNQDADAAVSLYFLGRLGINVAYNSGVQYAAELIPTEVRGQGVSAIHMAGYLVLFASPYILLTENYWIAIPDLTLGILAILGAIFCLLLPETLNRALPISLEDGEAFGEGEKVWEFACFQKPQEDSVFASTTGLFSESSRF